MICSVIQIGKNYILNSNSCPVIRTNSEVKLELVHNFPASNKQFITIRDVHNKDRRGDPLISTILNSSDVLIEVQND